MTQVSFPETTGTISGASVTVENQPQKILLLAQKTPAGTAVSGALNENIQTNANALAGITSMGAGLVRAVRAVNKDTQLDCIFVDDSGVAYAVGAIDFTGSVATEAGELTVIISSKRNFTLSIAVAIGDTATVIGDALDVAILAAIATGLPVTSASTTGDVEITAENAGVEGNNIPIEVNNNIAGVVVAITAMAGGAVDPTLTGIFDVIGEERYQTIIWPWSKSLSELKTFCDSRFNVKDDLLDGLGFSHNVGSFSEISAELGLHNSFINLPTLKVETGGDLEGIELVEIPSVVSAYDAALTALKMTEGASIASTLAGEVGFDGTGGPALAARPLANTPIIELLPIKIGRGWTKLEAAQIVDLGGSIIGNNRAKNQVIMGQQVTTRLNDSGGNPDDSFKFVNYFLTSVAIREFYVNNLRKRNAQMRLNSAPVEGRPAATQESIEAACIEFNSTLAGPDYSLTRAGEESRIYYIANLIVRLNFQTGDVAISMKSPLVTQVRGIGANIEIALNITE